MRQPAAATEFLHIPIDTDTDPTALDVKVAVVDHWASTPPVGSPLYIPAEWGEETSSPFDAKVLIGPDASPASVELEAPNWYAACVLIGDDPETPIRRVGPIIAT